MYNAYTVQITKYGQPVLVIVTALNDEKGHPIAELFCSFPSPHKEQSFFELKFEGRIHYETGIEINEDFMLQEAIAQAQSDIALHVKRRYAEGDFLLNTGDWKMQEIGIPMLIHLHVREPVDEFLWAVLDNTKCKELHEAIKPIAVIPSLSREAI